jgi:hypothetical protein
MQQQSTFNFGLTKKFFFIYRTLSMRQKTQNDGNQGSNAKKNFFLVLFLSPLPRWVRLVKKTRAKNSHAWAPLKYLYQLEEIIIFSSAQNLRAATLKIKVCLARLENSFK